MPFLHRAIYRKKITSWLLDDNKPLVRKTTSAYGKFVIKYPVPFLCVQYLQPKTPVLMQKLAHIEYGPFFHTNYPHSLYSTKQRFMLLKKLYKVAITSLLASWVNLLPGFIAQSSRRCSGRGVYAIPSSLRKLLYSETWYGFGFISGYCSMIAFSKYTQMFELKFYTNYWKTLK